MPTAVIMIDLMGLVLIVLGFHLAFRQDLVRRWWSVLRHESQAPAHLQPLTDEDHARYAMRISGVMILAFGVAITLLFTLSHLR
jgi:hypothetical protein